MFFLPVLFVGLPDDDEAEKYDADGDDEPPAVAVCHEEAEDTVDGSLRHLVLAVEAELPLITIAGQRIQQIDVVGQPLEPERDGAEVLFRTEEIGEEEVAVDYCEACREGRSTDIHLVLHAVETSLQRIPIRSLIRLPLLDGDQLEQRSEDMGLFAIDEPQVSVHQATHKGEEQERVGDYHFNYKLLFLHLPFPV